MPSDAQMQPADVRDVVVAGDIEFIALHGVRQLPRDGQKSACQVRGPERRKKGVPVFLVVTGNPGAGTAR